MLKFIKKYNRVAAVEIQTAFDLFELEMKALIESLKEKKLIRVVKAGNGSFIELSGKAGACDFDAGICSF